MQNAASASSAGPDDPSSRKACDQCRVRKIRCDKEWPCSGCRVAKRSCTTTGAGQRPKEHRARVLISSQYERKIDHLDTRLANIETLLHNLTHSQNSTSIPSVPAHHVSMSAHAPSITANDSNAATSLAESDSSQDESDDFEESDDGGDGGDTGLTAETAGASAFVERDATHTALGEMNPNVKAALANLRQLVEMHKQRSISHGRRFPLQRQVPRGGLSKMPLPPIETVVRIVKGSKSSGPLLFDMTMQLIGITDFSKLCRMAYFPSDDSTDANLAIVNNGLYNLFMEQAALTKDPALRAEYEGYTTMCKANFETCLAQLPLFLSPKTENVMALNMGAIYMIDVSRPSVAWHLTSAAAQLCQTGGFHRVETLKKEAPDVAQLKTTLFFTVYTLEKTLALRLGRASVINDCDISIRPEMNFSGYTHVLETAFPTLWVKVSSLQGRTYEQLYSPAALAGSRETLIYKAQALAAEGRELEPMATVGRDRELEDLKDRKSSEFIEIFFKGDEVGYHVTMTLIYRAIPGPNRPFCDECLDSARKAMSTHLKCFELVNRNETFKAIYVNWTLMLTPFAPFFVLFCHVIETSSSRDSQLLQAFVTTLENAKDASETAEKLHRLCRVMLNVALLYVEAKTQQSQGYNPQFDMQQFDEPLGQLGIMPDDQMMVNAGDEFGAMQGGGMAYLGDFFSGSSGMTRLVENQDLLQIDLSSWLSPDSSSGTQ